MNKKLKSIGYNLLYRKGSTKCMLYVAVVNEK